MQEVSMATDRSENVEVLEPLRTGLGGNLFGYSE
jgi:hypothetical protein